MLLTDEESRMMTGMATSTQTPDDFVELCKALYGPAVDADQVWHDVVVKRSPDQADVSAKESKGKLKPTGRTAAENIALGTNTLGVLAAPAAVTGAVTLARQGQRGLPFKGAKAAVEGLERRTGRKTRTGGFLRQVASRSGRAGKIGAAALGTGAVGLQVGNAAGDAISAHHFSKPKNVEKSAIDVGADIKRMAENVVRFWNPDAAAKPAAAAPKPPAPGTRAAAKAKRAGQQSAQSQAARTAQARGLGADAATALGTKTGKVLAGTTALAGASAVNRRRQGSPYEYVPYGKRDEVDLEIHGQFTKFDDAKRQAFGWASITKIDGVPVVDRQDDYIDIEDLETAAYNYVHKSRVGGDMHRRNGDVPHKVSDMIESMVFTPEKIAKMGLPENFPQGWWVGYQIHDEDTWDEVRKRGRTGFSIHGRGLRKPHSLDELMGS